MALIKCPECNKEISDKAIMCIGCGYPIQSVQMPFKTIKDEKAINTANKPKRRSNHLKLPNGTGSIQKLSGKRRNPYAVYPPSHKSDYDINGKAKRKKSLGYFPTYRDAYDYLMKWNEQKKNKVICNTNYSEMITFAEAYKRWSKKELDNLSRSDTRVNKYQNAFKYSKSLWEIPMDEIFADEIQEAIDSCDKGYSTKNNIRILNSKVFNYCISNGLLSVNYAKFVSIGKNDNKNGEPLSIGEINALWRHCDDKDVQICLIYIYSGYRISELKECEIDLDEKVFRGGLKTDEGKNRVVPIHSSIFEFVKNFNQEEFNTTHWRRFEFERAKELCGIRLSPNGEKRTPHDFRHTFSWLADKYNVDQTACKIIMGHTTGKDVHSRVYTHRDIEQLRNEIEKIKVE